MRAELEGVLIAYLAPVGYAVGLWLFFNWLILGDPLFFLKQQAPGGGGPNGGVAAVAAAPTHAIGLVEILRRLVELNWNLFPLSILVLVALVALFVVRRDLMSLTIAVLLALNASFTAIIVYASGAESYLQLRYNMRAMPIAMVGVAWLFLSVSERRTKLVVWGATLAVLVLSIPLTWREMRTLSDPVSRPGVHPRARDREGSGGNLVDRRLRGRDRGAEARRRVRPAGRARAGRDPHRRRADLQRHAPVGQARALSRPHRQGRPLLARRPRRDRSDASATCLPPTSRTT